MARKLGSKNKGPRAKARTPYETYESWYDKYTKGSKANWFSPKYSEAEFNEQYELAKRAKLKNPARTVAMSQEYVNRKFETQYKKLYGEELPDISTEEKREALFTQFIADFGYTWEQGRDEFEKYFY